MDSFALSSTANHEELGIQFYTSTDLSPAIGVHVLFCRQGDSGAHAQSGTPQGDLHAGGPVHPKIPIIHRPG